jgi:hypothetical protein
METMADKLEILKTLANSRLFGQLKPEILKAIFTESLPILKLKPNSDPWNFA